MRYSQEQIDFLRVNSPLMRRKELTDKFNKTFGTSQTITQISSYCTKYKIKGMPSQFTKGFTPWNKGKHCPHSVISAQKTGFKKGQLPARTRPVGSERVNRDGYIEIKVAMPNKWRLKHVVEYEKHHDLPKGYVVRFLDGDKTNLAIDNLIALSTRANMLVNSKRTGLKGLITDKHSHLTVINIATLKALIKEKS